MDLIGSLQKEDFYIKLRKQAEKNLKEGNDIVLTRDQILNIVIELKVPEIVDVKPNDLEIKLDSGSPYEKLRLLVVKFDRNLPEIFPGIASLMGTKKLRSVGTAVIEESESCWGGYVLC